MKIIWPLLFLVSSGAAWYHGYRTRPDEDRPRKSKLPKDYLVGLNYLLNEETDKAVDVFIKMLEVDSDTVETHLAVAKLFRRRGEVDRAIRIHQNIIARPQLEKILREQSLYELGQDYLSAGMLDRAERVFNELVNAKSHSAQALKTLTDIAQQEKDWEKAIKFAEKYQSVTRQNMQSVIAHYYCEIAEEAVEHSQYDVAEDYVNQAWSADKRCVRASLLQAQIFMHRGDYKAALKCLKKIKEQNSDYLSEAIDMMSACHEHLDQKTDFMDYLEKLITEFPRVPVAVNLAQQISKWKGVKEAVNFVADYVRRYPSFKGIYHYINLYMTNVEGRAKEDLYILQNMMKKVIAEKPDYQCHSCGFSGKSLHWLCPGCKQWSTIMPVYSLEKMV